MLSSADIELLTSIRHHLHRHPELSLEESMTATYLADKLREIGVEVVSGIGGHGLVATIHGTGKGPGIGLRADMDALAITERSEHDHVSVNSGCMHACGHDGHMTMLLGAALILSRCEDLARSVHFIFQPAEERFGGARMMIEDGIFDRFPMSKVFGLHNWPGVPLGEVVIHDGPVMSGTSEFTLMFKAEGGHASMPHLTGDPLLAGGHFMTGIQQAVSRSVDPLEASVVTVGSFRGGQAQNIIPNSSELLGTVRAFRSETLLHLRQRVRTIAQAAAAIANCGWELIFDEPLCSPVVNTPQERDLMRRAALDTGLKLASLAPSMGGDDFGDLLAHRPGAYAFLGNGPLLPEGGLHQPKYDFNDQAIGLGAALLAKVARLAINQELD